ncbi:MAG: hypothetical protein ACE5OR_04745 [bacterium]
MTHTESTLCTIGVRTMRDISDKPLLTTFVAVCLIGILLFGTLGAAEAQGNVVDIRNLGHRDWKMEGFSLDKKLELYVQARGAGDRRSDYIYAYAWILDARTRDVVWEMNLDNTSQRRRRRDLEYEGSLTLPRGDYEVYFAISPFSFGEIRIEGLGDLLEGIFRGFKERRYSKRWGITIDVRNEKEMKYVHQYDPTKRDERVIVQMIRMGDDEFRKEGFGLKRPTTVRVYAIGEGSRSDREMYDYGWIVDTESRARMWEMTSRNTDHAGGADKNIIYDGQIDLPAGNFMVSFVTDGSHSYEGWNAQPPYDPTHWGITLWATGSDFSPHDVIPFEESERRRPIVQMTRMRDDEFESRGFTLTKPADLHIYALGEYCSGRFCDYGGILNAHTREKVWSMTRRNTHHAGGAEKNRLFDDIVRLPAGDYIVYYTTDGSHSYRDWNAGPPYDPEAWGITISVVDENVRPEDVKEYRERGDPNILVNLTGLGDRERRRARFRLSGITKIRIYAIGEGDRDDMYDYGWIESDRGRVVWEMTYRNTVHAGGARKNRLFNDTIILDAGEYEVRFVTDGSHSFEDWNANPPDDPFHWGITVMEEE